MDFAPSARSDELKAKLVEFDDDIVRPAEPIYRAQREESGDPHFPPPVMEELKIEARKRDLWNLFMPEGEHGAELSNLDYAPLCEVMGTSPLLVAKRRTARRPTPATWRSSPSSARRCSRSSGCSRCSNGEIRSCFAMTEPWVASSDATNISSRIDARRRRLRDQRPQVVHERRARPALQGRGLHGRHRSRRRPVPPPVDDPRADGRARRHRACAACPCSATPRAAVTARRCGRTCACPKENLLGEEGSGFAIAQARLGPGRIHHCMRAIGLAERALDLMCMRAQTRVAFGKPLADQGVVRSASPSRACRSSRCGCSR